MNPRRQRTYAHCSRCQQSKQTPKKWGCRKWMCFTHYIVRAKPHPIHCQTTSQNTPEPGKRLGVRCPAAVSSTVLFAIQNEYAVSHFWHGLRTGICTRKIRGCMQRRKSTSRQTRADWENLVWITFPFSCSKRMPVYHHHHVFCWLHSAMSRSCTSNSSSVEENHGTCNPSILSKKTPAHAILQHYRSKLQHMQFFDNIEENPGTCNSWTLLKKTTACAIIPYRQTKTQNIVKLSKNGQRNSWTMSKTTLEHAILRHR